MSVYGVDNQEGGQHSSTDGSSIVGKLENDKVLDVNNENNNNDIIDVLGAVM